MGKDRTVVIIPKEHDKLGKQLRGKYARVFIEEVPVVPEDSN